ncbi:MAG: carboxypeptidase-like regulatory domain-containing protein [Acidobacteria bacterium]|nr:carboxypeptidase-like regulatory domain-containing protein [Acidobacteriota bacterium]
MSVERHLRDIIVMLSLVLLVALSSAARAAEVTGNVIFSGDTVADVVISIEDLRVEGPPDAIVHSIDHRNLNFVPHVLAVRTGSTVRFENSDGMPCRVYSTSPAANFVLRLEAGKPTTITFDHAGVIEVRCAQHSRQYAYILVKENPFFALTDAKGEYRISNVPPGRYTLQAWYEGKVIERSTIDLGSKKQRVDFKVSRDTASKEPDQSQRRLWASISAWWGLLLARR